MRVMRAETGFPGSPMACMAPSLPKSRGFAGADRHLPEGEVEACVFQNRANEIVITHRGAADGDENVGEAGCLFHL